MPTRAHIAFYDQQDQPLDRPSILLYRHSDGYPSAVLPDIVPFLQWFGTRRGLADSEYAAARLLQYLCNQYDQHSAAFTASRGKLPENTPFTGTLGYGICPDNRLHGDIEYLYAVMPGQLVVHGRVNFTNFEDLEFTELGAIDLTGRTRLTPKELDALARCCEEAASPAT